MRASRDLDRRLAALVLVAAPLVATAARAQLAGATLGAATAALDDGAPAYVAFTDPLPSLATTSEELRTAYDDLCRDDDGGLDTYRCVDKVIRAMTKRYVPLLDACDHRGIFALAYLETTKEYQRASLESGFFHDPEFVNHEDVVFAQLYFDAYDAYARGDRAAVPPAWRVAFDAAADRSVTTSGDVLLGISAHINRDLPIVLATIGLVDPATGASRKPDHDAVNGFLARVQLDAPIRAAWDPTYASGAEVPGLGAAALSLIQTWRENAWRFAEQLVAAQTPEEEQRILQAIEAAAYDEALVLRAATSYVAPLQSSAERDAYCAAQGDAR